MAHTLSASLPMVPAAVEGRVHKRIPSLAVQRRSGTILTAVRMLCLSDCAFRKRYEQLGRYQRGTNKLDMYQSMPIAQEAALSETFAREQIKWMHTLPSGKRLEVIEQTASMEGKALGVQVLEPMVFIHGSYHAAWCYAEYWMPHFSALGHDCYAISLLGQGTSDLPDEPVAGTIQSHASDIAHFIRQRLEAPPVLVGHSFGGLVIQAYLADVDAKWEGPASNTTEGPLRPYASLAGAILACSVPPTGNMGLVMRYLRTKPIASIKVTLSLAAKKFEEWTWLCRESFFSPAMPDAEVQRFQKLLKGSSKVPLFDLRKLNASLPVAKPPEHAPPILVLGAENDFVVDEVGLNETADFYGVKPVVVPNIAHDVMLDLEWQSAAGVISEWIRRVRQGQQPKILP